MDFQSPAHPFADMGVRGFHNDRHAKTFVLLPELRFVKVAPSQQTTSSSEVRVFPLVRIGLLAFSWSDSSSLETTSETSSEATYSLSASLWLSSLPLCPDDSDPISSSLESLPERFGVDLLDELDLFLYPLAIRDVLIEDFMTSSHFCTAHCPGRTHHAKLKLRKNHTSEHGCACTRPLKECQDVHSQYPPCVRRKEICSSFHGPPAKANQRYTMLLSFHPCDRLS
eukprot:748226-Hanusia_phi.AAC.3